MGRAYQEILCYREGFEQMNRLESARHATHDSLVDREFVDPDLI
jgi:hypothetical protein